MLYTRSDEKSSGFYSCSAPGFALSDQVPVRVHARVLMRYELSVKTLSLHVYVFMAYT